MTLLVTPKYYDFFSRSLMPIQHYWPVRDDNKCASIKYAVDWGNSHKQLVLYIYLHAVIYIFRQLSFAVFKLQIWRQSQFDSIEIQLSCNVQLLLKMSDLSGLSLSSEIVPHK